MQLVPCEHCSSVDTNPSQNFIVSPRIPFFRDPPRVITISKPSGKSDVDKNLNLLDSNNVSLFEVQDEKMEVAHIFDPLLELNRLQCRANNGHDLVLRWK